MNYKMSKEKNSSMNETFDFIIEKILYKSFSKKKVQKLYKESKYLFMQFRSKSAVVKYIKKYTKA